jgi:SAM-dependent methyltransferase
MSALEARHGREFRTREIGRAVRALSARYVERRESLASCTALTSDGKRAAFSLFYAPLHWLVVDRIARELAAPLPRPDRIVDLGCGTGSAGAAWADTYQDPPRLEGFDRSDWAIAEASWTYRVVGLAGSARRADAVRVRLPRGGSAVVAAYLVNELSAPSRRQLLDRLLHGDGEGRTTLIVEPIARKLTPWWDEWRARVESSGGRVDEWRFEPDLPERLEAIGRSAGLETRELTAKSLFIPGR